VTREQVYGRRPVRELLRGRRGVLELWASERALRAEAWLRETPGLRVQVRPERALTAEAGTADHQGVLAWCEPYPYADAHELAAADEPILVCLDGVTDPHNLGAVIRAAECAGASGIVLPAHRAVRVTPVVCRSSAGAVEHLPVAIVTNLASWIRDVRRPGIWFWAATADAGTSLWSADLTGGVGLVLGAEGKGLRPLVRRACDDEVSIPLVGTIESLNVSVAAALLLFEARRQRSLEPAHG
jgi:23S rRNA (guanosine2251-2'-O)-methyltransferase